jgi:hypothetical protein
LVRPAGAFWVASALKSAKNGDVSRRVDDGHTFGFGLSNISRKSRSSSFVFLALSFTSGIGGAWELFFWRFEGFFSPGALKHLGG